MEATHPIIRSMSCSYPGEADTLGVTRKMDLTSGLDLMLSSELAQNALPGDELGRDTGHQAIVRKKSWTESVKDNSDQPGPGMTD